MGGVPKLQFYIYRWGNLQFCSGVFVSPGRNLKSLKEISVKGTNVVVAAFAGDIGDADVCMFKQIFGIIQTILIEQGGKTQIAVLELVGKILIIISKFFGSGVKRNVFGKVLGYVGNNLMDQKGIGGRFSRNQNCLIGNFGAYGVKDTLFHIEI